MAHTNPNTSERFCCRHCGSDVALAIEPGGDLSYQCQNPRCQWAGSVDCPEALALKPAAAEVKAAQPAARTARERAADKAAYHLAGGLQIRRIAGAYLVPSGTRGGVIHRVDDSGVCSCEAGQHGRACWHVEAVDIVTRQAAVAA